MKLNYFVRILLVILFNFTTQAKACDCIEDKPIEEAFKSAQLVIHAKVLTKEYINYVQTLNPQWVDTINLRLKEKGQLIDLNTMASNVIKVKIQILKSFKNKTHLDTLIIFTPRNTSNCGYTKFEIGKEFLIFNGSDFLKNNYLKGLPDQKIHLKNTFWTNKCTRTNEVNKQDLDSLNLFIAPIRVLNPKFKKSEYYLDSMTNERIYTNADILPQFKSGHIDLIDFYKTNGSFAPLETEVSDTSFNTQVSFIINPNGRISRIRFINSELKPAEKAIIEFIKKMPPWNPGKSGNNFISFEVVLNFRFESKREN